MRVGDRPDNPWPPFALVGLVCFVADVVARAVVSVVTSFSICAAQLFDAGDSSGTTWFSATVSVELSPTSQARVASAR